MKYRRLDETGDYVLGRRNIFYFNTAAVGQACKTRLLLLQGEWWENIEDGLPLFQEIINTFHGENTNMEYIDLIFSERILGTQGVTEILFFDSSFNVFQRSYSAICEVQTSFNEPFNLQINGIVGQPLNITV